MSDVVTLQTWDNHQEHQQIRSGTSMLTVLVQHMLFTNMLTISNRSDLYQLADALLHVYQHAARRVTSPEGNTLTHHKERPPWNVSGEGCLECSR